jgi:hypothetical protein
MSSVCGRGTERTSSTVDRDSVVGIALPTEANLRAIGKNLERVYPLDHSLDFSELLVRIDQAKQTPPRGRE